MRPVNEVVLLHPASSYGLDAVINVGLHPVNNFVLYPFDNLVLHPVDNVVIHPLPNHINESEHGCCINYSIMVVVLIHFCRVPAIKNK